MADKHVPGRDGEHPCSRRAFLAAGVCVAGAGLVRGTPVGEESAPLRLPLGKQPSRVVQVQSNHVVMGSTVRPSVLSEMVEQALLRLTGASDSAGAWRSLLAPEDVIGLKFNSSSQSTIGTSDAVADAVITSLTSAGWPASQIVCIEAPVGVAQRHGTRTPRFGFEKSPTDFKSGADELALVLSQVSAIVDIPYLKTHNIAGMSGSLKNLSHGLIKHPARYHGNGCTPYIPDIVAHTPIRAKLRLCLMDALRIVFDKGPDAHVDNVTDAGVIVASTDPVAADAVGLALINESRRRKGLPVLAAAAGQIPHIAAAHRQGLGIALLHGIDLTELKIGGK